MRRRYSDYRRSGWRRLRPRRYGLFRSVQLNAAGWAAVAACCLVGAAAGYAIGALAGWPAPTGPVIGALSSLATLVAVDRRRWGRVWSGYSWGDTAQAAQRAVAELRQRGLPVESNTYPDGRGGLRYRHRDTRRVARALRDLGIPPPRRW